MWLQTGVEIGAGQTVSYYHFNNSDFVIFFVALAVAALLGQEGYSVWWGFLIGALVLFIVIYRVGKRGEVQEKKEKMEREMEIQRGKEESGREIQALLVRIEAGQVMARGAKARKARDKIDVSDPNLTPEELQVLTLVKRNRGEAFVAKNQRLILEQARQLGEISESHSESKSKGEPCKSQDK